MGSCVFKAGYTLYADTCIGRCLHNRYISNFQRHYGETAMHSKLTPFFYNDLLILPIPVLVNNYAYLVGDVVENVIVLVDVGDATMIKKMNLHPAAILTTHKHWDHSGGNRDMRALYPDLKIYGGERDRVPDCTDNVADGEVVSFGNLRFRAMWTPGHTRGHVVWRLDCSSFGCADCVFTGDLIMLGGCGASFEGPIKQMNASLAMMTQLPDETLVWPGHEMAVDNLELAVFIEPENMAAVLKLVWAITQREARNCTCPSTIGEEKLYNPFLRTSDPRLLAVLGLREMANNSENTPEKIATLCFHAIVHKSGEMHQQMRAAARAERQNQQQQGNTQQNEQHTDQQANAQGDQQTGQQQQRRCGRCPRCRKNQQGNTQGDQQAGQQWSQRCGRSGCTRCQGNQQENVPGHHPGCPHIQIVQGDQQGYDWISQQRIQREDGAVTLSMAQSTTVT